MNSMLLLLLLLLMMMMVMMMKMMRLTTNRPLSTTTCQHAHKPIQTGQARTSEQAWVNGQTDNQEINWFMLVRTFQTSS